MIPKIIHYCWFGKKSLPPLAKKCIKSWKKFFPDYEIKEWNESNYDVNKISYTKEAYVAKKYAFVSDFARFDILNEYGGIYFDTDVEVIKDMSPIIEKGAFAGIETAGGLAAGLGIAALQRDSIIAEVIESYKNSHFINEDGTQNLLTVVDRVSSIFEKHGFVKENRIQNIGNFTIYPSEYFCPKNIFTAETVITPNTFTNHHYDGSWLTVPEKIGIKMVWLVSSVFGQKAGKAFSNFSRNCIKKLFIGKK